MIPYFIRIFYSIFNSIFYLNFRRVFSESKACQTQNSALQNDVLLRMFSRESSNKVAKRFDFHVTPFH